MRTQKNKNNYLHIRIDNELKKKYQNYCNINGYSISKKLRLFIKSELKNEKNKVE